MPSRRRFLAAVGAAAVGASAGCLGFGQSGYDDAADDAGDRTDWPTYGHDGHNTNYNPGGTAPRTGVTERWRVETSALTAQPVISDGTVFAVDGADVRAIDAESGEVRWSVAPDNRAATYWAPPTVVDGVAYLGDGDERLRAFDAETGETLWTRTFGGGDRFEAVYGSPTVGTGGTLYVGTTGGRIYGVDPSNGETRWSTSVFGQILTTVVADRMLVLATTEGGDAYAVSDSGRQHWQTALPDLSHTTPAVAGGTLYVGCFDGKVYAIDAGRGRIEWSAHVGGFIEGGLAVADGRVYAQGGRELHALDADSGRGRWRAPIGSSGDHTPVVVGDTVYVGGDRLRAFEPDGGTGVADVRVGATRFTKSFSGDGSSPGGVSHVAGGDGLLVAGVRLGEDERAVVAFEEP